MTSVLSRLVPILIILTVATLVETLLPLRRQSRTANGRLQTNLVLVALTLTMNLFLNAVLAGGAVFLGAHGYGLFGWLGIQGVLATLIALPILDFGAYAVHVFMHKHEWTWRFHSVHHIDASVDATTSFRQHPFEGLLRFAFAAAFAWALGASPETIALYRLLSGANSVLEHSNLRVPRGLDRALIWFWVTPNMHKLHHSRLRRETDSNYGNLFSWYDRGFRTFSSSDRAATVTYGLDGFDTGASQSLTAALLLPQHDVRQAS